MLRSHVAPPWPGCAALALVLSFMAGITAVLLMWALYPLNYNYGQALKMSNFFYNAQRVGAPPARQQRPLALQLAAL